MEYRIILKATEDGNSAEAYADISFPVGAYFTTHATIANALVQLLPILMGEVTQRLEPVIVPEEQVEEPEQTSDPLYAEDKG